jgi:hypothetical protein
VRHLWSLVVALVLGAAIFFLLGVFLTRTGGPGSGWEGDTILGFAAAAGAGMAMALMLLPRLSPLGPFLVGVVYLGTVGWLYSDPSGFRDAVPDVILQSRRVAVVPFLALLAVPLLGTALVVDRWRRYAPMAALAPMPHQPGLLPQQGPPPGSAPPDYGVEYGPQQYPPIGAPYSGPPAYRQETPWGGPPPHDTETTHRL